MPRPLAGFALVLVAGLTLSACSGEDSVVAEQPSALIGTWLMTDLTGRSYVTPDRTMTAPDFTRPGEGAVTISGSTSATLRYVTEAYGFDQPTQQRISLSTFPPGDHLPEGPWIMLTLDSGSYGYLTIGNGQNSTQHYVYYSESPLSLNRSSVRVRPFTVEYYDYEANETRTIQVSGTLTFATNQYQAGVETDAPAFNAPQLDRTWEYRFVFDDDGTFRSEQTAGSRTVSVTGRWDATDNRLRASLTYGYETVTTEYGYRIDGGALVLNTAPTSCEDYCLRWREELLYLPTGSLRASRDEWTYRLTPSTSKGLPASPLVIQGDVREALRDQLLPGAPADDGSLRPAGNPRAAGGF